MGSTPGRRGPISAAEFAFMDSHFGDMTDSAIAEAIHRTVEVVSKRRIHFEKGLVAHQEGNEDYIEVLHAEYFWPELKKQLSSLEEISYFEQEWASYMQQFPEVVHTDKVMMIDTIMLAIQINRCLADKGRISREVAMYTKLIEDEYEKLQDEQDKSQLSNWNMQLNAIRAAATTLTKQYTDLQQRKDQKFQLLKATREQRFKSMQDSRKNIFEMIKLLDERDKRIRENRILSLFNDAVEKTSNEFMTMQDFPDGSKDFILLNEDTVKKVQQEGLEKSE